MNYNSFKNEIKKRFSDCDDFAVRDSVAGDGTAFSLLYIINLCEKRYVSESIFESIYSSDKRLTVESIPRILSSLPLTKCSGVEAAIELLLAGNAVLCFGNEDVTAFGIDSKNESGRALMQPESEVAVRGPRQGFVESAEANVTMFRKIIKSSSLKVKNAVFGSLTSTNVKIVYYEGIARKDVLDELELRLSKIQMNSCIDSGYLEMCLQGHKFKLFSGLGNS